MKRVISQIVLKHKSTKVDITPERVILYTFKPDDYIISGSEREWLISGKISDPANSKEHSSLPVTS